MIPVRRDRQRDGKGNAAGNGRPILKNLTRASCPHITKSKIGRKLTVRLFLQSVQTTYDTPAHCANKEMSGKRAALYAVAKPRTEREATN